MGAEAAAHPHRPAVFLVPFPAQGHITPMLQLASVLAAHGVAPTVAVPDFIYRRIAASSCSGGVALASIPSGIVLQDADASPGFRDIVHSMEHHMPLHLERMLTTTTTSPRSSRPPVACVVVDVLASWAVPVAARCGVPAAGFWPAMLACYRVVAAIPELLEKGLISESGTPISSADASSDSDEQVVQDDSRRTIRGLEILPAQLDDLRVEELPWLVGDSATRRSRFAFWLQTLHRARGFRWVLVNSFPAEATGVCPPAAAGPGHVYDDDAHRLARQQQQGPPHVLPVGPALLPPPPPPPGIGIGERTKQQPQRGSNDGDDGGGDHHPSSTSSSMWRADSTCIGWLDAQRAGSVVYVSFGSWVGPIGAGRVRELALGLEATRRPFLWALKRDAAWRAGLPDGFADRVAGNGGRGKLVDWAPQRDVLAHAAVGCYLTHCGWNSTLEAISHGVRLLCYPVSGDQFINCAYITGVWRIGLRIAGGMTRDDVSEGIGRVMDEDDGGEGRQLREKVGALRDRVVAAEARRAAERNVRSFVDEITRDEQPAERSPAVVGAAGATIQQHAVVAI